MLMEDVTYAPYWTINQLLEKDRRTVIIYRDIGVDGIHALPDANLGGEMHDVVHTAESAAYQVRVADISLEKLDLIIERIGSTLPAMNLLDKVVDDTQLVSALKQSTGEMTADKTGPARDQYRLRHILSFGSALAADELGKAAYLPVGCLVLTQEGQVVFLEQPEKLVPFDLFELFVVLAKIEAAKFRLLPCPSGRREGRPPRFSAQRRISS